MANYQLLNDHIDVIPILGRDPAGDLVPLPAGIVPSLKNSDPASVNAVISPIASGGYSLDINALVPAVTNVSIELDDGSLTPYTLVVDVVSDLVPTSVAPNLQAVTFTLQPVPVAPAPAPAPAAPTA